MTTNLANVEFSADLHCDIDSCPLTIRSAGRTIVVEVPDVATGLKVLRLGLPRGSRRKRLHSLKSLLELLAASLQVTVNGNPILEIGRNMGSPWWCLIGLPALNIRVMPLLAGVR